MDGPRHGQTASEEGPLAVRASPPARGVRNSVARRRRNAPSPTRDPGRRRPGGAYQGRRPPREGRRTQSDGDVQVPRHGRRGSDGGRPRFDTSGGPNRWECRSGLAQYAATYGAGAIVLMASDGPEDAAREAIAFGAQVLRVKEDIADAGRIVRDLAAATEPFSMATLREPYRVEGKKTMLFEIWEDLGGMPD